jgi:hypothetical protein
VASAPLAPPPPHPTTPRPHTPPFGYTCPQSFVNPVLWERGTNWETILINWHVKRFKKWLITNKNFQIKFVPKKTLFHIHCIPHCTLFWREQSSWIRKFQVCTAVLNCPEQFLTILLHPSTHAPISLSLLFLLLVICKKSTTLLTLIFVN